MRIVPFFSVLCNENDGKSDENNQWCEYGNCFDRVHYR